MRQGFTLIEVLVVMAIIGLLTSILLPNISMAQNRAKEAAVKAIAHNVQAELEGYNIENYAYPDGQNLPLADLTVLLKLKNAFKNPYTGVAYTSGDTAGKIIYDSNLQDGSYQLTSFKKDGMSELLVLTNN